MFTFGQMSHLEQMSTHQIPTSLRRYSFRIRDEKLSHQRRRSGDKKKDVLSEELTNAIRHMVANISKSFIVDWYTSISPTNHDFVASCEHLIEEALLKLAELCVCKLDKYKVGQLITSLLHDHILNEKTTEKITSIENQIDNYEYDICQNSAVRLFGLLSNETLRRVVFTTINLAKNADSHYLHNHNSRYHTAFSRLYGNSIPSDQDRQSQESNDYDSPFNDRNSKETIKTTSALYTLVIAMLTKAAFMPIIDNISEPKWLFAVIIWLCKKEERVKALREESLRREEEKKRLHEQSFKVNNQTTPFSSTTDDPTQMPCPSQKTSIVVTNTKGYRALDLEEAIDIASANINFENPICDSLQRPLDNIEIYSTEEVKSNNSCYVLYCIRYDGLCYKHPSAGEFGFISEQPNVPIIDRRQQTRKASNNKRAPSSSSSQNDNADTSRKSFRRVMTIKRRFREFVLLQLRLEENPKIRPYMKNIPKPTKLKAATQNIFSLPGINNIKLDQSTIKLRQRFLERFLNALNSSPFIANSYEFKEFFSYNVNPTIGMSKSKSTILQVNLNKVFVDSVRSAFSLIRSTLPGDDIQSLNCIGRSDPDAWLTELQQSTLKLHIQTRTSHSKMNLERLIDSKLLSLNDSPNRSYKGSSLGRYHQRSGAFDWMGVSRGGSLKANMFKSNSSSSANTNSPIFMSRSSSASSTSPKYSSHDVELNSKSSSSESIYHDASSSFDTNIRNAQQFQYNAIQICDSIPIASNFIDIIHYSINGDAACSQSPMNYLARLLLGRSIER